MRPAFTVSYFIGRFRGLACNKHAFLSPVLLHPWWSTDSVTIQINRINIHFKLLGTPAVSHTSGLCFRKAAITKFVSHLRISPLAPPAARSDDLSHLKRPPHLALLWRSNRRSGDQYRSDNELMRRGKLRASRHKIFGVILGFTRRRLGGSGALKNLGNPPLTFKKHWH